MIGAPASMGALILIPFLQIAGKSGLLIAAVLSGFSGPAQALSTAVLVIAMIVTGIIILAALIQLRDNKKAAEEPAAQEPDETEKNRLEIERVIGEINDVFKEISSLS